MSEHVSGKAPVHGKAVEEFRALVDLSAYLLSLSRCRGFVVDW
jgi:hypothetical protein